MSIIIGADLVPTASNQKLFSRGEVEELFGELLLKTLKEADYRIFNLETPLTDVAAPINKVGGALLAPTSTVTAMKKIGVDLFSLANNHIMDQGEQGLDSTCKTLKRAGISYVGVGRDIQTASKPHVFVVKGKKIGVYSCAEHEFSIATNKHCGANPVDFLDAPDHIVQLKKQCDYVIVLYHGGKEYYRYPSPILQKVCRKFVEKGANLVVCQHSHCIGSYEYYKDNMIIYGQGNFIFDDGDMDCLQTGVLIKIDDDFKISFLPIHRTRNCIRMAIGDLAENILTQMSERSAEIIEPGVIENKYLAFAADYHNYYLKAMHGHTTKALLYRILNRVSGRKWEKWYLARQYKLMDQLCLLNYIECEAHRELLLAGLHSGK